MFFAAFVAVFSLSAVAADKPKPQAESAQSQEDLFKTMKNDKELSSFVDMVDNSGLDKILEQKDKVMTVFAPTNSALKKLPSDVSKKIDSDKAALKKFVE